MHHVHRIAKLAKRMDILNILLPSLWLTWGALRRRGICTVLNGAKFYWLLLFYWCSCCKDVSFFLASACKYSKSKGGYNLSRDQPADRKRNFLSNPVVPTGFMDGYVGVCFAKALHVLNTSAGQGLPQYA